MNRLGRKVFHWLLVCILCYSACKYETIEGSGSVGRALDRAKEDLLVRDSLLAESMRGSRGDGNRGPDSPTNPPPLEKITKI